MARGLRVPYIPLDTMSKLFRSEHVHALTINTTCRERESHGKRATTVVNRPRLNGGRGQGEAVRQGGAAG